MILKIIWAAFPPSVPAFFALAFPAAKKSSTHVGLQIQNELKFCYTNR